LRVLPEESPAFPANLRPRATNSRKMLKITRIRARMEYNFTGTTFTMTTIMANPNPRNTICLIRK